MGTGSQLDTSTYEDLDARMAEGVIPPRPDYVRDPEEWRRWYDEHVRCATPGHSTFIRARGSRFCTRCLAAESVSGVPSSACVVLFHPEDRRVLVELHPSGVGLPGGKREEGDATSLACAARELFEETGARLRSARSILIYEAGPYLCEAWLAVEAELGDVLPVGAAWAEAEELTAQGSRFPEYCSRLFARLAAGRLGDLRCV